MRNIIDIYPETNVDVKCKQFGEGEGAEYHIVMRADLPNKSLFIAQQAALLRTIDLFWKEYLSPDVKIAFQRFFLSDAANQEVDLLDFLTEVEPCATSYVQQPPLCGARVALWIYAVKGFAKQENNGAIEFCHNGLAHSWTAANFLDEADSKHQTTQLLLNYERSLCERNMNIADNCVRTWFFVRDVDVNYRGVVEGRRENFDTVGLTRDTHYIASTGIEGRHAAGGVKVVFDAYAIKGLKQNQLSYLYAHTHLNPTYEYGVTFERGACVEYADRKHLFISGTASIDNRGEVVNEGSVLRQAERMLKNVEALLAERNATFEDVMQMIVYLRDTSDYRVINNLFTDLFPVMPIVIVLAPVCRPKWLIEMECIAVVPNATDRFPAF